MLRERGGGFGARGWAGFTSAVLNIQRLRAHPDSVSGLVKPSLEARLPGQLWLRAPTWAAPSRNGAGSLGVPRHGPGASPPVPPKEKARRWFGAADVSVSRWLSEKGNRRALPGAVTIINDTYQ